MSQVLYNKYRPQVFADVYGQPVVTAALRNELRTGRLAHAYLFTGSRGTGKTTCARILAKAVNCLDLRDGDPCNDCEICRGIDRGSVMDVVEIDAASNNGVDNIRDLRDEVFFSPAVARYRVYIIDEVHMLSAGAFNALLKTLEEPPEHAIFILATTEVHKLPATILSRCQRFDFGRIPPSDIAARLHYVAGQENFTLTEDAAMTLARLADGGMRDALSLLDQCLTRSNDVTVETVTETCGMAGNDCLYELSAAVTGRDPGEALRILERLHNASRDMERLCAELIEFYRDLMIVKTVRDPAELLAVTKSELSQMGSEANKYDLSGLLRCLEILQKGYERLRAGVSRRVEMEMLLIKLCSPEQEIEKKLRVDSGELKVRSIHQSTQPQIIPTAAPTSIYSPVPVNNSQLSTFNFQLSEGEESFARWDEVLSQLSASCPPLYGVLLGSAALTRGDIVLVVTGNAMFRELVTKDNNKALLAAAIREVTGKTYRIGIKKTETAAAAEKNEPKDPLSAFIKQSRELGVTVDS